MAYHLPIYRGSSTNATVWSVYFVEGGQAQPLIIDTAQAMNVIRIPVRFCMIHLSFLSFYCFGFLRDLAFEPIQGDHNLLIFTFRQFFQTVKSSHMKN